MAIYQKKDGLYGAYSITAETCTQIAANLARLTGLTPKFRVFFREGDRLEFEDPEDFGRDVLFRADAIERIYVEAGEETAPVHGWVSLKSTRPPVWIELAGNKEACAAARMELLNEFGACRSWFHDIARWLDNTQLVGVVFLSILTGFALTKEPMTSGSMWERFSALSQLVVLAAAASGVVVSVLYVGFRRIEFEIGASRVFSGRRRLFRSFVLGTIVLGTVVVVGQQILLRMLNLS